jgi:hypothetical protein
MSNRVFLSPGYYPLPDIGRPVANGKIYVGIVDLDPQLISNQKQLRIVRESGEELEVSQPIPTSKGGVPVYNGFPVTILVDGSYSLKVLDSNDTQVYYVPSNTDNSGDTVKTIEELRELSGGFQDQSVQVLGYYEAGDGGGGPDRIWDEGQIPEFYVDNGGSVIVPNAGDGSAAWLIKNLGSLDIGWFGATASSSDNVIAIQATHDACINGGTLTSPYGHFKTSPLNFSKNIRIVGQGTRSESGGNLWQPAGAQTHVLKWDGGTFPTISYGIGIENLTISGGSRTDISDALLVFEDAGMGNFNDLNVVDGTGGYGVRFKNAQDLHFNQCLFSDIGDNTLQKAALYADPTSSNNVNNIYFIDCHYESIGWTLLSSSGASDDQIEIIGGKSENRETVNSEVITDFTFPLFALSNGQRFICDDLTLTNLNLFSGSTFLIGGAKNTRITNATVQNNEDQTGNFIEITGDSSGYVVRDNGGLNVGRVVNTSTKAGYYEDSWWSNDSRETNRRANLDATAPTIDKITANAGGNYVYGTASSLTGKSLAYNTNSDAVCGVKLPLGSQSTILVSFRVQSSTPITVSLGVRTAAGTYTPLKTGVAVSPGWQTITLPLTTTQMLTAYEAVVLKEGVGATTLFVDGAWIDVGAWITPPFSADNFTAAGAVLWIVESADVLTYQYKIVGNSMTISWYINASTISITGSPSTSIRIKIPDDKLAATQDVSIIRNLESGVWSVGYCNTQNGITFIDIYTGLSGGTNWTASTNGTNTTGSITFQIQ